MRALTPQLCPKAQLARPLQRPRTATSAARVLFEVTADHVDNPLVRIAPLLRREDCEMLALREGLYADSLHRTTVLMSGDIEAVLTLDERLHDEVPELNPRVEELSWNELCSLFAPVDNYEHATGELTRLLSDFGVNILQSFPTTYLRILPTGKKATYGFGAVFHRPANLPIELVERRLADVVSKRGGAYVVSPGSFDDVDPYSVSRRIASGWHTRRSTSPVDRRPHVQDSDRAVIGRVEVRLEYDRLGLQAGAIEAIESTGGSVSIPYGGMTADGGAYLDIVVRAARGRHLELIGDSVARSLGDSQVTVTELPCRRPMVIVVSMMDHNGSTIEVLESLAAMDCDVLQTCCGHFFPALGEQDVLIPGWSVAAIVDNRDNRCEAEITNELETIAQRRDGNAVVGRSFSDVLGRC